MARLRFANRYRVCDTVGLLVEEFSSNGKVCLNHLCQPRGQAQTDLRSECSRADAAYFDPSETGSTWTVM